MNRTQTEIEDVLAIRQAVAGIQPPVPDGCSALGRLLAVSQRDTAIALGDFSCDGKVGSEDALLSLQVPAGMPVAAYYQCPRADTPVYISY